MAEAKHTPGPWRFVETGRSGHPFEKDWRVIQAGNEVVVGPDMYLSSQSGRDPEPECGVRVNKANAERIVACVNACEGIPTEALEAGVVREMIEALEALVRQVSCAHYLIVEACGPTNASILEQCMERAKAVLAKLRGEQP